MQVPSYACAITGCNHFICPVIPTSVTVFRDKYTDGGGGVWFLRNLDFRATDLSMAIAVPIKHVRVYTHIPHTNNALICILAYVISCFFPTNPCSSLCNLW